ncbi:MAG: AAA family ATPase [Chloroflexaceae bacterium]|nr:AAA family ATPase [Chloroflexaceae bacterium]
MQVYLWFLIGLPGSGKSYLAKQLARQSPGSSIISTDALRAHLFGHEALQGPWPLIWQVVEQQLALAVGQILSGRIPGAIYDATNCARRQRREAIALAKGVGFTQIMGIWVNTPLELCLERNHNRERVVPKEVILRMSRQLAGAPPALGEGFAGLVCKRPPGIGRPWSNTSDRKCGYCGLEGG